MNTFIDSIKYSKNILINGSVQSGKTNIILNFALKSIKDGNDVVIFVNNYLMDLMQLRQRFEYLCRKENVDYSIVKYIDKQINNPLDSIRPNIYVLLCNSKKVILFNSLYNYNQRKLITIIDESDLFNQDASKNEKDTLSNVSKNLLHIFDKSTSIMRVTATSFSHIFTSEINPIRSSEIYFLPTSENYISFGHEKFKCICLFDTYSKLLDSLQSESQESDSDSDLGIESETVFNKYKVDLYLGRGCVYTSQQIKLLYHILNSDRTYFESKNILPITIINISMTIENHVYIQTLVRNKFKDCTTILVNNGDVNMLYPENFKINDQYVEYSVDTIQKAFKKIQNDNNSHKHKKAEDPITFYNYNHKMVVVITCKQMGRGISTRSEHENFVNIVDTPIIYANSIIYGCSTSRTMDELIQAALRIGGIFPGYEQVDGFELRLHTTGNIIESITEQYKWFDSIKNNIIEDQKNNLNSKLTELVTSLTEKPLRKPISISKGKFHCEKINDVYECTEDKIKKALTIAGIEYKPKKAVGGDIINNMIILFEDHISKPVTYTEIAKLGLEKINTKTNKPYFEHNNYDQLKNSISSILLKDIKSVSPHFKRETINNQFHYSLITN